MSRALRVPGRSRRGDAGVRAVLAGAASAAAAEVEDSLAAPPDPTAAAFFDVDNTMIRGASIYFFGKGMAGRGLITTILVERYTASGIECVTKQIVLLVLSQRCNNCSLR